MKCSFYFSQHLESISSFQILQSITKSKPTIKTEAIHRITILESCSTSARALRTSWSKSMVFCQALCATVTRPPQPGPPHFFCPSSVLQFGPPHSVSEQEAPWGVPQVCNKPRNRHKVQRVNLLQQNICAVPGWPQGVCRWSSARVLENRVWDGERSKEFRNKLTCLFLRKYQKFKTFINSFCPIELEYHMDSVQGANIICYNELKSVCMRATERFPFILTSWI